MSIHVDGEYDLFKSKAARDEALQKVSDNAAKFRSDAVAAVAHFPVGWQGKGEDIRRTLIAAGIVPHHHNAWGALITRLLKLHIIEDTGRMAPMRYVRSHGRKTTVYRVR